jgi:CheY-like chemotaxis protein
VVVIEDNADAAEMLCMMLELAGCTAASASSGPEGLELLRRDPPNVVLCDIGLPGEMSGYEVARAIRADASLRGVFAIALTGYGQEEDRRKTREAGFDAHLTKPVEPDELLALLGRGGKP